MRRALLATPNVASLRRATCMAAVWLLTSVDALGVNAALEARWGEYANRVAESAPIQPECVPEMIRPPEGTEIRGTFLFIHGFLSCNQQLRDLGQAIALSGYLVIMPLMPGHGRAWPALDEDDYFDLPRPGDWRGRFDEFVAEMNDLMAVAPGEKVIGGLSVGAAVSLAAHLEHPGAYDRHVLFVPFLGVPGGPVGAAAVTSLSRIPILQEISVAAMGWRPICHEKRRLGRAGYCDYRLKHLGAMHAMASRTFRRLAEKPMDVPLQIFAIESDPSVSQARIEGLEAVQSATGRTQAFFYPPGVPHSLLSRADNPGADMWWLGDVFARSVAFVVEGRASKNRVKPSD